MARPQSYATHRRWMPLYHFVAMPIIYANLGVALWRFVQTPARDTAWQLLVAFAIAAGFIAVRISTLIVQSRVIRLEQRLRLAAILPPDLRDRIGDLRTGQLVGLRFASDAEAPELVRRCLSGELRGAGDVKRQVRDWQPDHSRA